MRWEVELLLYVMLVSFALYTLSTRNLLVAVVGLAIFNFVAAIIMVSMGAIDVAFTEAVIGAGVVGVYSIIAVYKTSPESRD
jgi:uncharacterized MnhB-related membrane protein